VQTIAGSGTTKTTTTALTASPNPSALGGAIDFTVTVTGTTAKPTGRVLFMVDGVVVGNPSGEPLAPAAGATARATLQLALATLAHGKHKVSATYLGDSVYKGSTAPVTQTVN
jgi:sulfur relay (sulfurtransferase) complex TusBCD TusD component (DsrE family)